MGVDFRKVYSRTVMTVIKQEDLIQSVADALQYISYYHPADFIKSLTRRLRERAIAGRARCHRAAPHQLAHVRRRPSPHLPGHRHRHRLPQDRHERSVGRHHDASKTWSTKACAAPTTIPTTSCAPASSPTPPGARKNTKDNTPAVINIQLVPGDGVDVIVAAKGGGSEAKSKFAMLNPSRLDRRLGSENRADHGRGLVSSGHARHRHRRHRRKSHAAGERIADGSHRHPGADRARRRTTRAEELRIELYKKVNALGIGAQGLGGLTTVLDVKVRDYPTHAANLPIAMIPNCAATRHAHFHLDGSGPAHLEPPIARRLAEAHLRSRRTRAA